MLEPSNNSELPPIPGKRYFTIGEVSDLCGVKPHVLRYWEQEFTQLKPVKRRGNRATISVRICWSSGISAIIRSMVWAWRSLVARLHGVQGVASSNLVAPTNTYVSPVEPLWSHPWSQSK